LNVTKQSLTSVIHEFIRAENELDKQAWLSLFAKDAVHEPGTRRIVGLDAIAENWDNSISMVGIRLWCEDPILVNGSEAIAVLRCRINARPDEFRVVNHYHFDDNGKIINLRNFVPD
jgi:hypothetical protein